MTGGMRKEVGMKDGMNGAGMMGGREDGDRNSSMSFAATK